MDLKKILSILIVLTVYINYENYIKKDSGKLLQEVKVLESRILQEKEIIANKEDYSHKIEKFIFNDYFFSEKVNYSKSMAKLQDIIVVASNDLCSVKRIKWSSTEINTNWYSKLAMDVSLECTSNNFDKFIINLKKVKKFYKIENLLVSKNRKKNILNINFQILAFRKNNDK